MEKVTVAQKIAELDAKRAPGNNEWESYRTLSATETIPTNQLTSLGQQVENAVELLRLRKKFENDTRREIEKVDLNRPKNWLEEGTQQVNELTKLREKHKSHIGWRKSPKDRDGVPFTMDEFVQFLAGLAKGAVALFAFLMLTVSAFSQQTNLFNNQAPNLPFYPTTINAGGLSGVFVPLYNEPLLNAFTNYYTNSNPLLGWSTNYQGTNSAILTNSTGIPTNYSSGFIYPVGVAKSLNISIGVGGFPSNSVADQLIAVFDQSVDGFSWTNLCTISLTNLTGQGAGLPQYGVTNINVGAMSQVRLHSLANNGLGAWTNCWWSLGCKLGL